MLLHCTQCSTCYSVLIFCHITQYFSCLESYRILVQQIAPARCPICINDNWLNQTLWFNGSDCLAATGICWKKKIISPITIYWNPYILYVQLAFATLLIAKKPCHEPYGLFTTSFIVGKFNDQCCASTGLRLKKISRATVIITIWHIDGTTYQRLVTVYECSIFKLLDSPHLIINHKGNSHFIL